MSEPKFKRGDIVTSGPYTYIVIGVAHEPLNATYDESLLKSSLGESALFHRGLTPKNPLIIDRFYWTAAVWSTPNAYGNPVAESELTKVGEAVIEE